MNPFPNALRSCALFADIDPDDLDKMLTCLNARFISADKGEYLMTEGAPAQYIGLLLSGRAQVVRTDYFGNRSIAVSIEPGELFAESFACAAVESLPVSVEACEKCTALLLDCRRIMNSCCNVCAFHSRLIFNLMKMLALKNLSMHQKAEITSRRSTREKLMTYLTLQAKQAGSSRFTIPFDRQALSDYLGVDRSGLSMELSRLRREGRIEYFKNSFHLLDDFARP